MNLRIVYKKEGDYTAYVPSLPGCISEDETNEEALEDIKEAIELYLEPIEDDLMLENPEYVEVSLLAKFAPYLL